MGKTTIRIPSATPDWSLEAWQFLPESGQAPFPTIVMAHGFAGRKEDSLEGFATAFQNIGCAVLCFDYRHWGGSDGTPRQILTPARQVQDYHTVIAYARSHPETFDPDKVACWGTSMSGGHSFMVAAQDPRLAFGIAECPQVDGLAAATKMSPLHFLRLGLWGAVSGVKHMLGFEPDFMPVFGEEGGWAFLNTSDSIPGYLSLGGTLGHVENRVQTWVAFPLLQYRPTAYVHNIKMPFLCCIGTSDTMTPVEAAHKAIRKVPKGEVYTYQGGHFSPYPGNEAHEETVRAQLDFIKRQLSLP